MLAPLLALALLAAPGAKAIAATNTTCSVLGGKVNDQSKTVTVRGHDYRICCGGCDSALLKNPDQYLAKDGTPKNAKQN